MKFHYRYVVLFISMLTSFSAAENQVNIQFRAFSVTGDIGEIQCQTKKGPVQVEVPGDRRSAPIQYRGGSEIIFFRAEDQVAGSAIVPLAKTILPKGLRNPLIIFLPREGEDRPPYQLKVIQDDPRDFADGMLKVMNLTPKALHINLGQAGEVNRQLKPSEILTYRLPDGFKGNVPVKIAMRRGGEMIPLMNSRVFPTKSARDIYFIWPTRREGAGHKVRISTLRERGDVARGRLNL